MTEIGAAVARFNDGKLDADGLREFLTEFDYVATPPAPRRPEFGTAAYERYYNAVLDHDDVKAGAFTEVETLASMGRIPLDLFLEVRKAVLGV